MIIDIHIHCFPDEVASQSVAVRAEMFNMTPQTDGTIRGVKASMLKSGVDLGVLQPISYKPQQTIKMNRWAAEHTEDKIISFGTIHPDFPDYRQEIEWLAEHNFKGVKFHSDCQGYYVDDPHMLRIYEAIFDAGLIILFHSGKDPGLPAPYHATPSRLRKVLDTFPEATMIAAHMGGYRYWKEVEEYLLGEDIYFDTAYSIHELERERAEKFIKAHGANKILFGTDSPWRDQGTDIALIKSLNLEDTEIKGILGNNAKKILGIS